MLVFFSFIVAILFLAFLAHCISTKRRLKGLTAELDSEQVKVRELAVLNDIATLFYTNLDERSLIETIVDRAKDLVRSEFSALLLFEDKKVSCFYTSIGDSTPCKEKPVGILQRVLTEGMPIRGRDIRAMEGFRGFPADHPVTVRSILVVPLIINSEVRGEVILANRIGKDEFSPKDEDLLLTFGFHVAFALERARYHQEIAKLATSDGLTGLNNHRTFQERLEVEIERTRRYGKSLSILLMDLDLFKQLNDTYGHRRGDDILKRVACRIVENIRNIDFAARYGGEEFVVILPETLPDGALITAERIRSSFDRYKMRFNATEIAVTVSIGVATYPSDAQDREHLIEQADRALYAAKNAGRNKVCTVADLSLPG